MSNTYTPQTLYVIIEGWNVIPQTIYDDQDFAEKAAMKLKNEWRDKIMNIYPNYTNEDLQIMLKLNITLNKFDVMTLSNWLFYNVKHEIHETI